MDACQNESVAQAFQPASWGQARKPALPAKRISVVYRLRGSSQSGSNCHAHIPQRCGAIEIGGANAVGEGRLRCLLQASRGVVRAKMAEEENGGKEGRGRVGDAAPGDVRRAAVDGLEEPPAPA